MLSKVAFSIVDFMIKRGDISIQDIKEYIVKLYDVDELTATEDIKGFLNRLVCCHVIEKDKYDFDSLNGDEKICKHINIEDEILAYCKANDIIFSATIELTYLCNESCVHCYAHYEENALSLKYISFNKIKDVLDDLYDMGCIYLSFTGGDPFMHKDFMKIFKYARKKGFICNIYTNGLFLYSNQKYIKELIKYRVNSFYISLYGSKKETHEAVTQTENSFEKTTAVIRKIKELGGDVIVNIMALKINSFDVENIVKMLDEMQVSYRIDMSVAPRINGSKEPQSFFVNDKKEIHKLHELSMRNDYFKDRLGDIKYLVDSNASDFVCGAGITSISITPDGTVFPCVSLKIPLGNIYDSNIPTIWSGNIRKILREKLKMKYFKLCLNCQVKDICSVCPALSLYETGDLHSCNFINRTIANCF